MRIRYPLNNQRILSVELFGYLFTLSIIFQVELCFKQKTNFKTWLFFGFD